MEKYSLDLRDTNGTRTRRVIIKAEAASDAEVIRIAHALMDLTLFEGATTTEAIVTGANDREVATIGDSEGDCSYLDRPVRYGAGFRSDPDVT